MADITTNQAPAVDKNTAMVNYLLTCTDIAGSTLYFNFANIKNGITQFITLTQDKTIDVPFIDGSVLKRYSMTIISYLSISDNPIVKVAGYANENISDIAEVQTLIDWIQAQNNARNYPNFGTNCFVESIKTLTNNPVLDQIDATKTPPLAKYSFTIQVDYIDSSEKIWT